MEISPSSECRALSRTSLWEFPTQRMPRQSKKTSRSAALFISCRNDNLIRWSILCRYIQGSIRFFVRGSGSSLGAVLPFSLQTVGLFPRAFSTSQHFNFSHSYFLPSYFFISRLLSADPPGSGIAFATAPATFRPAPRMIKPRSHPPIQHLNISTSSFPSTATSDRISADSQDPCSDLRFS